MNARSSLLVAFVLCAPALSAAQFDIKDESQFKTLVSREATVQKLGTGMGFLEGPTWYAQAGTGGILVFSDIPKNELKKFVPGAEVSTFRTPSNNSNGNATDNEGRLVTAEHSGRRIALTEKDGNVITLVDQFNGKKLNSPNDVVVKSDGTVWFTDPDYGLNKNPKEQDGNYVYRYDPKIKENRAIIKDFDKPNGICFSPDEKKLYVADSGKPRHIRVFDVERDGSVANGKVFCQIDKGAPDGIRCDAGGRIWSSAADGIQIFGTDGKLIGKILVPESPANLCFGGSEGKTLFITARTSLYSIQTLVTAPKRR